MSAAAPWVALVLTLAWATNLPAMTLVKISGEELAERADLVVVGHARRFTGFHEGTRIHTQVSVEVQEVWRDSPHRIAEAPLSVKVLGGVVHDNAQAILGMPALPADRPLVLFLAWPRSHTGEWEVVGLSQGIWEVELDDHAALSPQALARAWVHPLGAGAASDERTTAAALRAQLGSGRRGR